MIVFKYKVDVSFTSLKYYDISTIRWWFWMWSPYTYFKGVIIRICGIYINIREKDASKKIEEAFDKIKQ